MNGRRIHGEVVARAATRLLVAGLLAAGLAAAVPVAPAVEAAEPAPTVLVKLAPSRPLPQGAREVAGWVEVPVPPGESVAAVLARWRGTAGVVAAEPNRVVSASPLPATRVGPGEDGTADPLAHHQWHMDVVQADSARAISRGDGVTVAVLDTGVSAGPDLACHTFGGEYDALRDIEGPGRAADSHGHGTHVAGTIAQCTGNGIGVAGMAPAATLLAVRVLDGEGNGTFASVAAGIDWARSHGADIINLSLGAGCDHPWPTCRSLIVDEAIDRAVAAGIVIVAASGNLRSPYLAYPAAHPDVISVGATAITGARAYYSNGGRDLDLVAPGGLPGGGGVLQESPDLGEWGYRERAGTSFAAPHVAGAAALLRSAVPDAPAGDVRAALRCTAADAGAPGADPLFGHGELRVADAATALLAGRPDLRPPAWPEGTLLAVSRTGRGTMRVTWSPARDCDVVTSYRIMRDGAEVARVPGHRTEAVVAGGPGVLGVEAVDRFGNRALGPTWEARTADEFGLVDAAQGMWHLPPWRPFYYGNPGDTPFVGDWDCDGVDTPGLYRRADGYVYLRNSNTPGVADVRFYFGDPGDVPLAGDFDGDGCDTVSLYRPAEARVYVINRLGRGDAGLGAADRSFPFGEAGDEPFVLDADGDGTDGVAVHRPATGEVFVRHRLAAGPADLQIAFAKPGDLVIGGDWDGDGTDAPGLRRPRERLFASLEGPFAAWGEPAWLPVAGRWVR